MRRLVASFALVASLVAASGASGASWAVPQIRVAVKSGLMGPSVEAFRADAALTERELAQILAGLDGEKPAVGTDRPVTMTQLNRALVRAVGLMPAAEEVRAELTRAGLAPPARAGWETVARLLELRFNHPAPRDGRELLPNDTATRAEAAYSVARVLDLSDWELERAAEAAASFAVSTLSGWQRRVLRRAVAFVGYPYVWGGMSESRQTLFGVTSRGGFDCSGFVWRVYKLERWSGAPRLGSSIRGRTTYAMSGEISRPARIRRAALRPADVIFFGARGSSSRPADVNHTGILLGDGWFVHSSGQGTTIAPLAGWYVERFAWARRPLAEVALR